MTVVTLTGYRPSPRYDGLPWTEAILDEAASPAGPWTAVETFTLTPVDSDPTDPLPRAFTTEIATITTGYVRIRFVDATGDEQATQPVAYPPTGDAYTPTVDEIAALIPARTVDADTGATLGTFTGATHPTASSVETIAQIAAAFVASRLGGVVDDVVAPQARHVAALRAAMQIELGYFPEQVRTDRSAYPELKALYDADLASIPGFVDVGDGTAGGGVTRNGFASVPTHGLSYDPLPRYLDLTDAQLP